MGNALRGDLPLPLLVLKERELEHNIGLMARWCLSQGVSLAPHVKTTMAPAIVERQLRAGAWGITVASPQQARLVQGIRADHVLIANEVADIGSLRLLAKLVCEGHSVYYCLVDSEAGIDLLERALEHVVGRLGILIEIGIPGARAGCRSDELVVVLADRLRNSSRLRLVGLEAFEGVVGGDEREMASAVDALMARIERLAVELDGRGAFAGADEIVLTAGGSAFFDRVAAGLVGAELSRPARVVLRSGCYVTHDHGFYERISPLGERATSDRLLPALELWASVLSRPEDDLVVLGFGKRDVSYDIDLPVVIGVRRARNGGGLEREAATTVVGLYDQHAVARTGNAALAVGDLVQVGISHPCTSFDKWRSIPLVAPNYDLLGVVETVFREEPA